MKYKNGYPINNIILGAGLYGLYAAMKLAEKKHTVLVLDCDEEPFTRGSYINQARLHNGYHYPRSYSTAIKSAKYFDRFLKDYRDCINTDFEQIYAVARHYSWTNGAQFKKFCGDVGVQCEDRPVEQYFNKNSVEAVFLTHEYSFDAQLLKKKLYEQAKTLGVEFCWFANISKIEKVNGNFEVSFSCADTKISAASPFLLNATYAGTNQIHELMGFEPLNIKYELCEVVLCNVSENIKNVGLTLMDGPFFSLMPFGKSGYHSITTVSKTPHVTCYESLPTFDCQNNRKDCIPEHTQNCNGCRCAPASAFHEMTQTAKKYLNPNIEIKYVKSLYTLKPILKTSEIDDSRPTVIRQYSENPDFYTVFSGKINTMYDLDEVLL
jgi:hypothetical protein